jgi:hypothetical protein
MAIDFAGLMYLVRSEHREDAAFVIKSWAESFGFSAELNGAFVRTLRETSDHNGHASESATEHVLRDAFWRLETIGRLKQPNGYARFEERLNRLSDLAQKLDASRAAAVGLLYTFDADGMQVVHDKRVRKHVEGVLSLLEWMGSRYLVEPEQWCALIDNAAFDLIPLNGMLFDEPPELIHERMQNTLNKMMKHRASEMDERLRTMPARIGAAFKEGRHDDLREHAIEAWVDVIDCLGYYDEAREKRALESRRRFVVVDTAREACIQRIQGEGSCAARAQSMRSSEMESSVRLACSNLVDKGVVCMTPAVASTSIVFATGALALFPCTPGA